MIDCTIVLGAVHLDVSIRHLIANLVESTTLRSLVRRHHILGAEIARIVQGLVLIGITHTLATGVWYFVGTPARVGLTDSHSSVAVHSGRALSVEQLVAAHLFGARRGPASESEAPAVATDAPLVLEGTFAASNGAPSFAIVSESGQPGLLYRVGEVMPGAIRLSEVGFDRVVLDRDGRRETLAFDLAAVASNSDPSGSADLAAALPESAEFSAVDNAVAEEGPVEAINLADQKAVAESYIRRITANPRAAVEEFGLQEVIRGQPSGYRVAQQTPYLDRADIRTGDVIVAVNGTPVGNPELDHLELTNLIAVGSTGVTVERDGKTLNLTSSDDPLQVRNTRRRETASRD